MQMHTQRLLKIAAATAAVALVAAGCGGSSDSSSASSAAAPGGAAYAGPVGDGEGTVNILAWPGYVEDGSTDPAVDWVTDFETEALILVSIIPIYVAQRFSSDTNKGGGII